MAAHHSPFPRFARQDKKKQRSGWLPLDLGGQEVVGRLHLQLRPGPEAAGEGRHALDRFDGALKEEQLAELRLLVTELLSNSVKHGGGHDWITLDVELYADAVRAVVTDHGGGFEPEPHPQPHADRPGGWGLCLVDRLADRWGVERDGGTAVWFELARIGFAHAV